MFIYLFVSEDVCILTVSSESRSGHAKVASLALSGMEWEHIEYVVMLLHPFYVMTKAVSTTQEPIIQSAWFVYNHLFTHLERFERKVMGNKKNNHFLINAIKAGTAKFSSYYSKTGDLFGDYFGITALLNPSIRTNAYSLDHWSLKEKELYISKAKDYYKQHYKLYEKERPQTQYLSQSNPLVSNWYLPLSPLPFLYID